MIEFAINYSLPAAEFLRAGKIKLDRFKVPDWPDLVAEAGKVLPVYVHFAINAGGKDSRTLDWGAADLLAKETKTPCVNLHLAPRAGQFETGNDPGSREVIEAMIADVKRAGEFFGIERVIVENVPFSNPDEAFARAAIEPAAIHEVIERTGAGMLLDLSHARLTARTLGVDEREYVSALPVGKIRELHLTGLQMWQGRMRDHMAFSEEDWEMTQWAMDEIRRGRWSKPGIAALEYGGVGAAFEWRCDPAMIAEQTPRLYEMVRGCEAD